MNTKIRKNAKSIVKYSFNSCVHSSNTAKGKKKPENGNRPKIKYFLENNVLIFGCVSYTYMFLTLFFRLSTPYIQERESKIFIK